MERNWTDGFLSTCSLWGVVICLVIHWVRILKVFLTTRRCYTASTLYTNCIILRRVVVRFGFEYSARNAFDCCERVIMMMECCCGSLLLEFRDKSHVLWCMSFVLTLLKDRTIFLVNINFVTFDDTNDLASLDLLRILLSF